MSRRGSSRMVKRIRSSSPEIIEARDDTFYYNDGSIVLSASDAPDHPETLIYFRVHSSVLIRHSAIFAEMFDQSKPSQADIYDGVPLIAMGDEARYLRGLLQALYEPERVFLPRFSDNTSDAFIGPLILAKKYEATALQDRIIAHIEGDWPSDNFKRWVARRLEIGREYPHPPSPEKLVHLVSVTKTWNELQNPVAMAYYLLSCNSPGKLMEPLLQAGDLIHIFHGRQTMEEFYKDAIGAGTGEPGLVLCAQCTLAIFRDALYLDMVKTNQPDLLIACADRASKIKAGEMDGLCGPKCRRKASDWMDGLKTALYSRIPEFFSPFAELG